LFDAPDSIVLECVEVSYVIHSIFVLFWRLWSDARVILMIVYLVRDTFFINVDYIS
jgi:hypothetical protein